MRTLNKVIEFQQEASNALFTKAQALAITMQLLELERRQPETRRKRLPCWKTR